MLLPNVSQLLSFTTASASFSGLSGAGTAQGLGGLFEGLGTGAEAMSTQNGLFGGLLGGILGEMGLNTAQSTAQSTTQDVAQGVAENAEFALLQVTQIVTVVYEEFSLLQASGAEFDNLNSAEALSAAYQQLGMTEADANSRAARLTIMFMVLDGRLTTADLIGSLDGQLGSQNIGVAQQRAFIQIEKTIQAFSLASVGSQGQVSGLLEKGQGLLSGVSIASLRGAEGQAVVESLGLDTGAKTSAENFDGGLFGRVNEIFTRLADKAAQHPEGQQLAAQLQQIATATQAISNQVVQDGGLTGLQNVNLQKITSEPNPQSEPPQATQQAIAAEIAEEQPLPATERAREVAAEEANLGRSANERATDKTAGKAADAPNGQANSLTKPPVLPEPAAPTYVVRPSAEGGVEVVDPQTGQILQTSTSSASPNSPQTGEAALAQSRGLETAQQVRLAQQIRVHVRTLAGHNGGQIVVGLNPKELGRVQVRLEITEGTVRGAITVQRADVAEAISRDIRALEQALQDVGLELAQEGIAIQLENHASGSHSNENEAKPKNGTPFASTSKEALLESQGQQESRWVNPDRLFDVEA